MWQSHHLRTRPLSSFLSRDFHQSTTRSWKFNNASHSCLCHVPKLFAIQALSFNLLSLFLLMYWHRYFTMTFCMILYLLLCTCQKWRNKDVQSITSLCFVIDVAIIVLVGDGDVMFCCLCCSILRNIFTHPCLNLSYGDLCTAPRKSVLSVYKPFFSKLDIVVYRNSKEHIGSSCSSLRGMF